MPARRAGRKRRIAQPVTVESKWGWGPGLDLGWCMVPRALLRSAPGLGITPEEGWLLVQLLDLKWSEGSAPVQTLCERCGQTPDSLHAMLRAMERRGLLKVIPKTSPPTRAAASVTGPSLPRRPDAEADPALSMDSRDGDDPIAALDPVSPGGPARAGRRPRGESTPVITGWELDLAPLLRVLSDFIMRGGDLSAGYLRLSPPAASDVAPQEEGETTCSASDAPESP